MDKAKAKILIVDDEPLKRSILEDELSGAGYVVATATNPLEAEPLLAKDGFDVILTDLRMPGQDGLTFLRELKQRWPRQAVIVMTAYGTVETAVEAMKLGAFDFLQKPFSTEELLLKLDKLFRYEQLASENEELRRQLAPQLEQTRLVGTSEAMRTVLARIHAVAGSDTTVLVDGESGTGKELVARMIHSTSWRASGPFVAVSCAALPESLVEAELFGHEMGAFTGATRQRIGRIELAHAGTLFLDDVEDIPLEVQVKLLRVLQQRSLERVGGEQVIQVNIRVIAATKKSLPAMVAAGQFRADLFYRLNVIPLHLPPLRERREDIELLVEHFLEKAAIKLNRGQMSISREALAKLQAYSWPGNVRELEHLVERMVALSTTDCLDENDVPELNPPEAPVDIVRLSLEDRASINLAELLAVVESRVVQWALNRTGGNLVRAAEMLGLPRSTLQYKVMKLQGIDSSSSAAGAETPSP
jgi:DNA-binding NtrC family response regulator